jgi:hypothetical protein
MPQALCCVPAPTSVCRLVYQLVSRYSTTARQGRRRTRGRRPGCREAHEDAGTLLPERLPAGGASPRVRTGSPNIRLLPREVASPVSKPAPWALASMPPNRKKAARQLRNGRVAYGNIPQTTILWALCCAGMRRGYVEGHSESWIVRGGTLCKVFVLSVALRLALASSR